MVVGYFQDSFKKSKEKWSALEHSKLVTVSVLSVAVLLAAVILYLVVVPIVSNIVIIKLLELRNGSKALSRWQHQPQPLLMHVYMWNLTNPEEVTSGIASPIFNQAGPYIYEQLTEKIPIEFKANSIVYNSRTNYQFRADLTAPATLDDIVTTLHAALYGAVTFVESMSPMLVPLVNKAVQSLFPGLDSIFVSARVGSYIFDGLPINCTNAKGSAATICLMLPKNLPPTVRKKQNSSDFLYSFLAHKNGTLLGPYEEDRGLTDIYNLGNMISAYNKNHLGQWQKDSDCDRLRGTDALIFAPIAQKTDKIQIFISDICQVVPLHFEKEDRQQGMDVFKFTASDKWLSSIVTNPENSCFCRKGKDRFCRSNGLRDISDCMKAPVVMSLPHLLQADEEFFTYARGMSPDPEKHRNELYIVPKTGTPVKAAKRIQLNFFLRRIKGFEMIQNVSEGLFPLFWLEESITITEDVLSSAKVPLTILKAAEISCLVLMVVALVVACSSLIAFLYLCVSHVSSSQVTTVISKSPQEGSQVQTYTTFKSGTVYPREVLAPQDLRQTPSP